jgi:hypothetical protein
MNVNGGRVIGYELKVIGGKRKKIIFDFLTNNH